jgi:hypothetical protein
MYPLQRDAISARPSGHSCEKVYARDVFPGFIMRSEPARWVLWMASELGPTPPDSLGALAMAWPRPHETNLQDV